MEILSSIFFQRATISMRQIRKRSLLIHAFEVASMFTTHLTVSVVPKWEATKYKYFVTVLA